MVNCRTCRLQIKPRGRGGRGLTCAKAPASHRQVSYRNCILFPRDRPTGLVRSYSKGRRSSVMALSSIEPFSGSGGSPFAARGAAVGRILGELTAVDRIKSVEQ